MMYVETKGLKKSEDFQKDIDLDSFLSSLKSSDKGMKNPMNVKVALTIRDLYGNHIVVHTYPVKNSDKRIKATFDKVDIDEYYAKTYGKSMEMIYALTATMIRSMVDSNIDVNRLSDIMLQSLMHPIGLLYKENYEPTLYVQIVVKDEMFDDFVGMLKKPDYVSESISDVKVTEIEYMLTYEKPYMDALLELKGE